MNVQCTHKYMVFPAADRAPRKRVYFYEGDRLVLDLVISLESEQPDHCFPVNMARFRGKTLRVECIPEGKLTFVQTDTPLLDYAGAARPLCHFTTRRGWMNDPNGLVYTGEKYLMFYQHNPAATYWENMHWGYAESSDLVHWREGEDKLFPDENGTVFSGSAWLDRENASGLMQDGVAPLLLFYTAAGDTSETSKGVPTTQRLAVSRDGGETLQLCETPLLREMYPLNRDPKVIRCEEGQCYILSLFLKDHDFALFRSDDLLHWQKIQQLCLPGDAECPDLYPLPVDGDEQNIRWVFSAASDRYLIGTFDGTHFSPETQEQRLGWGNAPYAAQSWSNLEGYRRVRTAFVNMMIPGNPFSCCMNLPQEMHLKHINGRLCLTAWPAAEVKKLYTGTRPIPLQRVTAASPLTESVGAKACDITLTISTRQDSTLHLFGLEIRYRAQEQTLSCLDRTAPVCGSGGQVTLRLIFDVMYTQIYADEGSVFMGIAHVLNTKEDTLTLHSAEATVQGEISTLGTFYAPDTQDP